MTDVHEQPAKTKSLTTAINDLKTSNNFIIVPKLKEPYSLHEKLIVTDLKSFFADFSEELIK